MRAEPIELIQQLKHCSLHFSVCILVWVTSLSSNCINFVNENNCWCLLLGQLKGISNYLGSVTNKHLYQLRTCKLEKGSAGLRGTGSCKHGLSSTRRAIHENSLWSLETNFLKLFFVDQREDNGLSKLLNLLVKASYLRVLYIGSFLKLHGLDSCVKFSWQSVKNQIAVLVNSYYVIWLELFWVNKACQWKVDGLSVCCLYYHCLVAFLRGLLIYLKNLVYSCNQIRKLFEIFYFFIAVLNV